MNLVQTIFLFAQQTGTDGGKGSGYSMILVFVLMIAIIYFFMIRPQKKKEKEAQAFRSNLQKGDKIVTIGGVHGKIAEVQDKTFIIEMEGGSKMKIEKAAVSHEVKE
ncbi:MAG: preprotein translocase subunit YajC [Bacteroidales bacterium]|jgi:preprotein translocase subunit YajC|nr:preprotein translocase subunit YajC [Bacteroidales bacterium]